jgi:protein phosphatase
MDIEIGSLTDVGRKRTHNEDYLGLFRLDSGEVLALVADGMGGHASGEVASRLAAETLHAIYREERAQAEVLTALKSALLVANFTVLQKSLEREDLQGMGTTATALVVKGEEAFIGHVGDSRAYLFRNGSLSQLTKDHSLVQRLVDQGLLKKEEASHHPQRNVITQTIGVNRDLAPELLGPIPVFPSDAFLL